LANRGSGWLYMFFPEQPASALSAAAATSDLIGTGGNGIGPPKGGVARFRGGKFRAAGTK
jgi:hypothetical protein